MNIMNKKSRNFLLIIFLLIIYFNNLSANTFTEKGSELPFSSGETLHYQLSYQGLLTSMIWADIADVKITFYANKKTPEQQNGHQFVLNLSTENYAKAEMIHPVRYTYTATTDETMQRTLLVEKIDTGASDSHEFIWLDWLNKETQLFKKREKELLSVNFFWADDKAVWEKDGTRGIPNFLSNYPLLDENQSYLIYKKDGKKITNSQILEPLSLIYNLRTLDIDSIKETNLVIKDDIRLYRIERIGMENIDANGTTYQSIKYKIHRDGKKDKHFYMWLSNDEKKIPLQFAADAPFGKLEIQLVKITGPDNLIATLNSF
ncbi:MAG: DUF3108 domain-containing protein [Pseudomonadota bacterium]